MQRVLVFVVLLLTAALVRAEDGDLSRHPLEDKVEALFEKATSTPQIIAASNQAQKLWDAEMNRCYIGLKGKLDEESFAILQSAQKKWLTYRDEQTKFLGNFYAQFEGTIWRVNAAEAATELTRTRAIELWRMLEHWKSDE